MRPVEAQFDRERIADTHAVFAIEHESDRTCNVGVEGEGDQIEHIPVILVRFPFGIGVEIQMRIVLRLDRDIDPFF